MITQLRGKRSYDAADVQAVYDQIGLFVSDAELDSALDAAAAELREVFDSVAIPAALLWSGGKDSIALAAVVERAGFSTIKGVMGVAAALEVPAQLAWARANRPAGVMIYDRSDFDLAWLRANPNMLFSRDGAECFLKNVTRWSQHRFLEAHGEHLMLNGRRRADGNWFNSKDERGVHQSRGGTWYSPIRDWPHELVLAAVRRHPGGCPPVYSWPRGWEHGTGPFPGWKFRGAFEYLQQIDPDYAAKVAAAMNED